jgi:hypothetical protein
MSKQEAAFRQAISYAREFENMMEYPVTGERRWLVNCGRCWPKKLDDGNYIYVVMPETGEIRFSEKPRPYSKIHHPELCHGKNVIGAGLFTVFQNQVIKISNESGHYGPDGLSMSYVKMAFEHWQAPLVENLEIDERWEVFGNQ